MASHLAQVQRRGRLVTGAALVHGHRAGEPLRGGRRLVEMATSVGERARLAADGRLASGWCIVGDGIAEIAGVGAAAP